MAVFTDIKEIPLFSYRVLYADPPWLFNNWSDKGEDRNPNQDYDCMPTDEIAAMPVGHLAAKDCVLFMWVTNPMLPDGLEVMRRWGFQYRALGFTWAKTTKQGLRADPPRPVPDDFNWQMNNGYWTRQNTEHCLIGVTGNISRNVGAAGVRELLIAGSGADKSQKPLESYERIERLVDGPYLELFARNTRRNWDSFGNEVHKFGERNS